MIEYRRKSSGAMLVVTTACGLCGEDLDEQQGMADHLPSCPVAHLYAEPRALRNGGPDPDRVQAALDDSAEPQTPDAPAAAPGGETA